MEKALSSFTHEPNQPVHNAVVQHLPSGYNFPTHMHNTVEIIICRQGVCVINLQDQQISLGEDEYIVLFPGVLHDTCTPSHTACTLLQTHFHADTFVGAFDPDYNAAARSFLLEVSTGKQKFFSGSVHPQLYYCVDSIRMELIEKRPSWKKMVNLYLSQVITLLSRDMHNSAVSSSAYRNKYLMKSLGYIQEHSSEPLNASDIAADAGISVRYLSRLFADELSISISAYINHVRIQKAIAMMVERPDYPLTSIAIDVGFSSLQYFSRVFKEKIEISPSRYFELFRTDR